MAVSQRTRKILLTIFLLLSPLVVAIMLYYAVKVPQSAGVPTSARQNTGAPPR